MTNDIHFDGVEVTYITTQIIDSTSPSVQRDVTLPLSHGSVLTLPVRERDDELVTAIRCFVFVLRPTSLGFPSVEQVVQVSRVC